MPIRCTSKAIILNDGKILLNRCIKPDGCAYYDLPGGGQRLYETMEETLIREVREETGYTIRVIRFAGLAEEIYLSALMREKYPEYTHRILHVFAAECTDAPRERPSEKDLQMEECVWMPLEMAEKQCINPEGIAQALRRIIQENETVYLGVRLIENVS
ncbi:MAG: NUDIX domain-containing protein [Clostridia bacterium]|nr:NUDIX domain-containing protein [Clostridia bacterium]